MLTDEVSSRGGVAIRQTIGPAGGRETGLPVANGKLFANAAGTDAVWMDNGNGSTGIAPDMNEEGRHSCLSFNDNGGQAFLPVIKKRKDQ
ncbi:MAG: hypothetical protein FWG50_07825 [Kiritimatiellaeota bacterium]|nr:hypothetical protein [Kiritimatiellota bacterium]